MRIRITRGIYGKREGGGVVEKTVEDAPFEIGEDEGKRLIDIGVAEDVTSDEGMEDECAAAMGEGDGGARDAVGEADHISMDGLDRMSMEGLRQLADGMGLKKNGGRQELIKRINDAMEEDGVLDGLDPADPE